MPLSEPVARTPSHIRRVVYEGFVREDGLWDIEGELFDTKAVDMPGPRDVGYWRAGQPIHHMRLRVTVDQKLVVQAIEGVMETHPLGGCPSTMGALQKMVGSCMAKGWRQDITTHLGKQAGCTHIRELLQNLATAAFQTLPVAFGTQPDVPPRHLGQCTGWDFNGPAIARFFPEFVGYQPPIKAGTKT